MNFQSPDQEGNEETKPVHKVNNDQTYSLTHSDDVVTNAFSYLDDFTDNMEQERDLRYNTLNRFVYNQYKMHDFDNFNNAEPTSSTDSNDTVDIPVKPHRNKASGSVPPNEDISGGVGSASLGETQPDASLNGEEATKVLAVSIADIAVPPPVDDDEYTSRALAAIADIAGQPDSSDVALTDNEVRANYIAEQRLDANQLKSILGELDPTAQQTEGTFAMSFKSKDNFNKDTKEYKKATMKNKKFLKKGSSFFTLRRSKSTTDVPAIATSSKSGSPKTPGLKRSQSGVLETSPGLDDVRAGSILKKKAEKERKKRKRLRLLSRGQRLQKKSSSKVSFDDYVTESEYESDDDDHLDWIQSPGYGPNGLNLSMFEERSSPELPPHPTPEEEEWNIPDNVQEIRPPKVVINSIRSFTTSANLDELASSDNLAGRRLPDSSDGTSSAESITTQQHVKTVQEAHRLAYKISYDDGETSDPFLSLELEPSSPADPSLYTDPSFYSPEYAGPSFPTHIEEGEEQGEVIALNMKVERGDTTAFTVDVGVQTSVNTVSVEVGPDPGLCWDSVGAFPGYVNATGSVSKGNKKSYKKIKKRYF